MQKDRGRKGRIRSINHALSPGVRRDPPPGQLGRLPEEAGVGSGSESKEGLGLGVGKENFRGNSKSICKSAEQRENKTGRAVRAGGRARWEEKRVEGPRVQQRPLVTVIGAVMCTRQCAALPLIIYGIFFSLK